MAEHSDIFEHDPSDLGGMVDQLLAEVSSVPCAPADGPEPSDAQQADARPAADESGRAGDDAGAAAEDALDQVESLASRVDALLAEASSNPSEQPKAGAGGESVEADSIKSDSIKSDSIKSDFIKSDSIKSDSIKSDSIEAESVVADSHESASPDASSSGHQSDQEPEPVASAPAEAEPGQSDPTATEPAGARVVTDIDALDEQLAEATGELIASDEAAPRVDPQPTASGRADAQAAAAEPTVPAEGQAESAGEAAAGVAQPEPAGQPGATPASCQSDRSRVVRVVEVSKLVFARAEPAALRGAALVSRPLASRPRIVRDTVGWIGLWTLFLAVCVWFTLVFLRTSETPASEAEPTALAQPE